MKKRFNTTGSCNPAMHYMVDTSKKLAQIEEYIDDGLYFTINRARQFGKTTTLKALFRNLSERYVVIPISFEGVGNLLFSSEESFCTKFKDIVETALTFSFSKDKTAMWKETIQTNSFDELSDSITEFCLQIDKPVLLLIDEVDKSTDNQLFLNFLGMLRNKYLDRDLKGMNSTFHSVVLAGVYDVKNLKIKLRPDEERKYNSPWNIASKFNVDMTFHPDEIITMLNEYEADYNTGMNKELISNEIYKYTSGYPFLVSEICSIVDKELDKDWSAQGVQEAVKTMLNNTEPNTLFKSIAQNLLNNKEFNDFMRSVSFDSREYPFSSIDPMIELGLTFSILKIENNKVRIHNLIFEDLIYNFYVLAELRGKYTSLRQDTAGYVLNGKLNMPYIIERFQKLIHNEYRKEDNVFLERQGRLLFLCFLKPIINGTGFYYVEPETRNGGRMDIVVTFGGEEFVIELKIWRGEKYEVEGKVQLAEYLKTRNLNEGYLVTFSFLKNKTIQEEPEWLEHDAKRIYEAVI
ncbi:MAG: AAA-like domain-containing protein [Paludibacteraceae bacterium]|nr:AAA-like domain-containing protein [Paludibacteraceae bacterium]